MQHLIDKANVLLEALPYIRQFTGKRMVIKYGGAAMAQKDLTSFVQDVVLLKFVGILPVVVHGGGPQIGQLLKRLSKESRFVEGMRVTDPETMEVVEMVLAGRINKDIVNLIQQCGGRAVGLCGKDGGLIRSRKLWLRSDDGQIRRDVDLGLVGEVEMVQPDVIDALQQSGFIPVVAPVGVGEDGQTYNINADLVAGKVAGALRAEKFILLTDVEGILNQENELISSVDAQQVRRLMADRVISGGMLPKVQCCIEALEAGVTKVHIIDGRVEHAILLEMFTDKGIGTQIVCQSSNSDTA
jgi:acetylglutamate kinase